MLDNLVFSVSRILPYFLLIVLGGFLRWRQILPEEFFTYANRFVFKVAIPVNLFCTISTLNGESGASTRFFLVALLGTLVSFTVIWIVTELLWKDKAIVGTLVQGAFRGNYVLLGMPIVEAVAGPGALQEAAVVMLVAVPVYNILAVVVLSVRSSRPEKVRLRELLGNIARNPLLWAMAIGGVILALSISLPYPVDRALHYVGSCGTPMGLLTVGGMFRLGDATARLKPALYAASIKNVIQPASLLPLAAAMGISGDEILVLLVLFAAPGAITSYPMACAMGGDGPLASNILILTTFVSAFALAGGIYVLRTLALI